MFYEPARVRFISLEELINNRTLEYLGEIPTRLYRLRSTLCRQFFFTTYHLAKIESSSSLSTTSHAKFSPVDNKAVKRERADRRRLNQWDNETRQRESSASTLSWTARRRGRVTHGAAGKVSRLLGVKCMNIIFADLVMAYCNSPSDLGYVEKPRQVESIM